MDIEIRIFRPNLFRKKAELKAYKTISRPTYVYGSDTWTNNETEITN